MSPFNIGEELMELRERTLRTRRRRDLAKIALPMLIVAIVTALGSVGFRTARERGLRLRSPAAGRRVAVGVSAAIMPTWPELRTPLPVASRSGRQELLIRFASKADADPFSPDPPVVATRAARVEPETWETLPFDFDSGVSPWEPWRPGREETAREAETRPAAEPAYEAQARPSGERSLIPSQGGAQAIVAAEGVARAGEAPRASTSTAGHAAGEVERAAGEESPELPGTQQGPRTPEAPVPREDKAAGPGGSERPAPGYAGPAGISSAPDGLSGPEGPRGPAEEVRVPAPGPASTAALGASAASAAGAAAPGAGSPGAGAGKPQATAATKAPGARPTPAPAGEAQAGPGAGREAPVEAAAVAPERTAVTPPLMLLTGVITSGERAYAIVRTPAGSWIMRPGDEIDEVVVRSIGPRTILVVKQGEEFLVELGGGGKR